MSVQYADMSMTPQSMTELPLRTCPTIGNVRDASREKISSIRHNGSKIMVQNGRWFLKKIIAASASLCIFHPV